MAILEMISILPRVSHAPDMVLNILNPLLVRTARSRIIHLRNDYKHLMSQIEKGLHSFHSSQAVPPSPPSTTITPPEPHQPPGPSEAPDIPFAEVDLVISGSPADTAGLKLGDKVKRFGNVHLLSHDPLSRVVEVVGNNEGREVRVLVERGRGVVEGVEDVELVLTPRRGWGGRGLLGCEYSLNLRYVITLGMGANCHMDLSLGHLKPL